MPNSYMGTDNRGVLTLENIDWEEVILSVKSCSLINLGSVSVKYVHFDLLKFSLSHDLKIHFSPTWWPCPDLI